MNEIIHFVARHGYWLLIGAILARQACLPIPANLILLAAGALASSGNLKVSAIVFLSVLTFLVADLAWYAAGLRWGKGVLHFLCGLSHEPSSCVHKATATFDRHGVRALLVSKFVLGLDAVAAPLAGASGTPPLHFLFFDVLGALLWTSSYVALGYILRDQLDRVADHLARAGTLVVLALATGLGIYVLRKLIRWLRFVREFKLARITPQQLHDKLMSGEEILLVDLQGSGNGPRELMAIPGAVRLDPRKLEQYKERYKDVDLSLSREVVLYCSCPGEFTSARVALAMRERGFERVRPLAGGLPAWRDSGFPVTPEVRVPLGPASSAS